MPATPRLQRRAPPHLWTATPHPRPPRPPGSPQVEVPVKRRATRTPLFLHRLRPSRRRALRLRCRPPRRPLRFRRNPAQDNLPPRHETRGVSDGIPRNRNSPRTNREIRPLRLDSMFRPGAGAGVGSRGLAAGSRRRAERSCEGTIHASRAALRRRREEGGYALPEGALAEEARQGRGGLRALRGEPGSWPTCWRASGRNPCKRATARASSPDH